jgi:hypothetical protein
MLLLILCPGTIPAPALVFTCPASCQLSSSWPASSRYATAAPCRLSSCCMTAPSPLKASTAADAMPARPRRRGQPPGKRLGTSPRPSECRFHIPWPLHLQSGRRRETIPEPFSYPAYRFLHARDWQRHHRLHSSGICRASRHYHRRNTATFAGTTTEDGPLISSPPS